MEEITEKKEGTNMPKQGSGRFGKYGDLKRKEKIRQTRLLKQDAGAKLMAKEPPRPNRKRQTEDDKR
jgi:hypothetical protein